MAHAKGFDKAKGKRSRDPVTLADIVDGLLAEEVFVARDAGGRARVAVARDRGAATGRRDRAGQPGGGPPGGRRDLGPWGAQARFLHEEIRRKADEALGGGRVTAIRIVVRNPS